MQYHQTQSKRGIDICQSCHSFYMIRFALTAYTLLLSCQDSVANIDHNFVRASEMMFV